MLGVLHHNCMVDIGICSTTFGRMINNLVSFLKAFPNGEIFLIKFILKLKWVRPL